ncbi:LexA repressor [bioreactor metagenome]|uniref:LexA repressor n=1 Tax=bioreactor metagenome TaxID=1076179 RepID=A0A645J4X0_9ZZZZ
MRRQHDVESGEVAIIIVNGDEGTCKKVLKHANGSITLVSLNPAFEPRYLTPQEIEELPVTIVGKVVELRGKF